jgi:DNA-directed RNA polymerase I subunit RPA1
VRFTFCSVAALNLMSSPHVIWFSLNFRFYSDEDVRARSICEITSHVAVDQLGTPTPGGVYDPRLGPSSADAPPCATCCQRYLQCPGHFGHIELCVPCYHPLLFTEMVQILRLKCFNCHKLRLSTRQINMYQTKFRLLRVGDYEQCVQVDKEIAMRTGEVDGKEGGSSSKAILKHEKGLAIDAYLKQVNAELDARPQTRTSTPPSVYEDVYRRQLIKTFIADIKSSKNACSQCGAYSPKIRQDQSNKIFQADLSKTAKRLNAAEGIRLQPALGVNDLEESDKRQQQAYDSEDDNVKESVPFDDDDDGDDVAPSGKDKYMPPREVQAQVKRTWLHHPELCDEVFALQGYNIFFLQAVPVPPNRYRPPMHLGGMMVEHAQNGYLNKILQANEMVRKHFAGNNEALAYQAWIELQTQLNCFMDSSKDPSSNMNPPLGIRQLLERKEGIFRKHMMGKRVNYACRSVISPDPYIGANEIGLPRYFAETLTYPTPVTDINIAEMRELVERGPFNYPGARWVEFPDRRVDLSKMDQHKREATAARLLTYAKTGGKPAIVGRQLRDGDMVLMNRQVGSFNCNDVVKSIPPMTRHICHAPL